GGGFFVIMINKILRFSIFVILLVGLPLLGLVLDGNDISPYLEFPPRTGNIEHAPFSWGFFSVIILLIIILIIPFSIRWISYYKRVLLKDTEKIDEIKYSFPKWGYPGLAICTLSWLFAWTRFDFFADFQVHTFTPLWISYIIIINALTYRRKGQCMLTDKPKRFLLLFPVSAVFWWFFEFLNRFVQNWHYVEAQSFSSLTYFILATLSFSTVLPAVLSTREYLMTFNRFTIPFNSWATFKTGKGKLFALLSLFSFSMALLLMGIYPNYLFPLLWVAPGVIIICLQVLFNEKHIFSDLNQGQWSFLVCACIAALICGFFWEMWNYYSYAKWIYSVPFVSRFFIFEMPVLGYAGYLPFGLECVIIGEMVYGK
ncbi:hypothetical protein ACFL20_06705, partial [Spirochaetota bacterium]